jgi:hypothetical protein
MDTGAPSAIICLHRFSFTFVPEKKKAPDLDTGAFHCVQSHITTFMDDNRITARIETLCEKVKVIRELERKYRTAKHRSRADRMAHASRELRLVLIRAELEQLRKQRNA